MKKISKPFWIFIGISALFFIILIIISSVLQLGERLRTIHVYLEWGFYGLSTILFTILIIRPLMIVIFSPTFSIDNLFTEEESTLCIKKLLKI